MGFLNCIFSFFLCKITSFIINSICLTKCDATLHCFVIKGIWFAVWAAQIFFFASESSWFFVLCFGSNSIFWTLSLFNSKQPELLHRDSTVSTFLMIGVFSVFFGILWLIRNIVSSVFHGIITCDTFSSSYCGGATPFFNFSFLWLLVWKCVEEGVSIGFPSKFLITGISILLVELLWPFSSKSAKNHPPGMCLCMASKLGNSRTVWRRSSKYNHFWSLTILHVKINENLIDNNELNFSNCTNNYQLQFSHTLLDPPMLHEQIQWKGMLN